MQCHVAQRGGEVAFGKQRGSGMGDAGPLCVLSVSFLINLRRGGAPLRCRSLPPSDFDRFAALMNTLSQVFCGYLCVCGH